MKPDNFGYKDKWKNILFVLFALFCVWLVFGSGRWILDLTI